MTVILEKDAAASVAEICLRLQGAYRAVRLYPPGHSMIESRMQPLGSSLAGFLALRGSLTFEVEESRLLYEGQEVYRQEPMRDEMAFALFREGVRTLTLHAGLEDGELRVLVESFGRAFVVGVLDEDLVTLLWEADFAHIDFKSVDPVQVELGDEVLEALVAQTLEKLDHSATADLSLVTAGWFGSDAGGSALAIESGVLVGSEDLARFARALDQEPAPLDQFVEVLVEMLQCANSEAGRRSTQDALGGVLATELQGCDLDAVLPIVRRLLSRGAEDPAYSAACEPVFAQLAQISILRPVVLELDGRLQDRRADVEWLLASLAPRGYTVLLDLLSEADGHRARRCLLNVLSNDTDLPLSLLKERLTDTRWFVVRNVVVVLGAVRDRCPADFLLPALHHADERVRLEAVRSLAGFASPRASVLLRSALGDDAPAVRTAAAHAIGRRGDTEALPELLARVRSAGFGKCGAAEVEAHLEAAAALGGEQVLTVLKGLCQDRLLRAQPVHVRIAAVRALARLGSIAADTLERASRSRNREVRVEARRALSCLRPVVVLRPPFGA